MKSTPKKSKKPSSVTKVRTGKIDKAIKANIKKEIKRLTNELGEPYVDMGINAGE